MGAGKIRQAVILAGGLGTRLLPLTKNKPKPMVPVNSRPFLEYLIGLLKENGIGEVVLLLGYLAEKVQEYFGDGSGFGIRIRYSVDDVSAETGTRIRNAAKLLDETFLLMYCDNYWPISMAKMAEFYNSAGKKYMMTVYSNSLNITKNNVMVKNGIVLKYDKERKSNGLNGVDIGFFILKKSILRIMPNANFSFEKAVLPVLIKKRELAAYTTNLRYYSISTMEKLKLAEKFLKPKKIVLCDRDGIINKKAGKAQYVKNWREFKFIPDAIKSLQLLKKSGFRIIMVTNQAGIGRKAMAKADLAEIHSRMQKELKRNKAGLDAIYFCPHDWEESCDCRKPKPGMLLDASNDFSFDLTKSFFIGDDERDVMAGKAAGCRTILVGKNSHNSTIKPDFACKSFYDAAKYIVKNNQL